MTILILMAVLVLAVPVNAKKHEPVGEPISVFPPGDPAVFTAGEPFHIKHGWKQDPKTEHAIGHWTFELDVDGIPREADFVMLWTEHGEAGKALVSHWVHNFPDGMVGAHTFTGHGHGPCQAGVDSGALPGPCAKRNEIVEYLTNSLTVEFN